MLKNRRRMSDADCPSTPGLLLGSLVLGAALVVGFSAGPRGELRAQRPEISGATDTADETQFKTVSGRVVDSQGDPISDATVVYRIGFQSESGEVTTTTDENGYYRLSVPHEGTHEAIVLWAFRSGYSIRTATHWLGEESEIALPETETTEFVITDPEGNPLAHASVTPSEYPVPNSAFPRGVVTPLEESAWSQTVPAAIASQLVETTNESGACVLQGVSRGLLRGIVVRTENLGEQQVELRRDLEVDSPIEIELLRVGSITIKLPGADPSRLQGTPVQIRTRLRDLALREWDRSHAILKGPADFARLRRDRQSTSSPAWETMTSTLEGSFDKEGVCRMQNVPEGRLTVSFEYSESADGVQMRPMLNEVDDLKVDRGQETELLCPMVKTVELRGRVVAGGEGVAGASVSVSPSGRAIRPYDRAKQTSVETDEQGQFRVRVLPKSVRLTVTIGDTDLTERYRFNAYRTVAADATVTTVPDIELRPLEEDERYIARVIDTEGAPVTAGYVAVLVSLNKRFAEYGGDSLDASGRVELSCSPLVWQIADRTQGAGFLDVLERDEKARSTVEVVLYPNEESVRRDDRRQFPHLKMVSRDPLVFEAVRAGHAPN